MTVPSSTARAELLTIDEAAEVLTVSRRFMYREHERGRITFGSRTRIKRSELERYLRANERTSAA
jgi:excisionase family DNA binding protein